jgi:hypothetical protein
MAKVWMRRVRWKGLVPEDIEKGHVGERWGASAEARGLEGSKGIVHLEFEGGLNEYRGGGGASECSGFRGPSSSAGVSRKA